MIKVLSALCTKGSAEDHDQRRVAAHLLASAPAGVGQRSWTSQLDAPEDVREHVGLEGGIRQLSCPMARAPRVVRGVECRPLDAVSVQLRLDDQELAALSSRYVSLVPTGFEYDRSGPQVRPISRRQFLAVDCQPARHPLLRPKMPTSRSRSLCPAPGSSAGANNPCRWP